MATSKNTGLRYADLPAIERAQFSDNAAATRAMESIRQILETRMGKGGQAVDKAVTWGDLVESGIAQMRGKNGKPIVVPTPTGPFLPSIPTVVDGIPPAPTGVRVTAGLANVIVEWDKPNFDYFGYAEVFRSTTNNLAGAISVGQTTGWVYADPVGTSDATYFYWVRFISVGGKVGPFNATAGAPGAISLDPAYLIDILSADDPTALLFKVTEPTEINGVPVPVGVYVRDAYFANGSISNAKIGTAAIDDAKIANLSAAKVTFGEMSGDRIAANSLDANRLTTDTLAARLAILTQAYVQDANIVNLNAAKVNFGQMSGNQVEANSMASNLLNVGFAYVRDSNIDTLNAGKVTFGQMSGDRIEANSMAANLATIGAAYIGTANIRDLSVNTLKLADQSVVVGSGGGYNQDWSVSPSLSIYVPSNAIILAIVDCYTSSNSATAASVVDIITNFGVARNLSGVGPASKTTFASGSVFTSDLTGPGAKSLTVQVTAHPGGGGAVVGRITLLAIMK